MNVARRPKAKPTPPPANPPIIIPRWLVIGVIILALVVWLISIWYSSQNPEWQVPASVHAIAVAVITGVMGYVTIKK